MKTCIELSSISFGVKLEQYSDKRFRLTYGKEVKDRLSYEQAGSALGFAVMHSLACDGNLDNQEAEKP